MYTNCFDGRIQHTVCRTKTLSKKIRVRFRRTLLLLLVCYFLFFATIRNAIEKRICTRKIARGIYTIYRPIVFAASLSEDRGMIPIKMDKSERLDTMIRKTFNMVLCFLFRYFFGIISIKYPSLSPTISAMISTINSRKYSIVSPLLV